MNFKEMKKIMLNGLIDNEYKKSLEGFINCSEKNGKTVDETIVNISKILIPNKN